MKPPPPPGLYRDVPYPTYDAWDCARSTELKRLAEGASPAHVRLASNGSGPSRDLGSALHLAVWQPLDYPHLVEVWTDTKTRTERFRARAAEIAAAGGLLITAEEAAHVTPMVAALRAHRRARPLLEACQERELSVVFDLQAEPMPDDTDPPLLATKARLDGVAAGLAAILDLKTTSDASPRAFPWAVRRYGYHYQAAVYLEAASASGLPAEHYCLVAIENHPPYAVAVYRLKLDAVQTARRELDPAIRTLARCYLTGQWPGYPEDIHEIDLPGGNQ